MLLKRLNLIVALLAVAMLASGQGLVTTASKDDWEEVNFEFNSAILSDGYPSLLRLAELLSQNPGYKVTLEGNTDWIGSHGYNDKLALRRAETVKSFLVKYGAKPDQVQTAAQGKRNPKVDNKTVEGRFMNRRVAMVVTDAEGRRVGAGGVGDAIKALEKLAAKQEECCNAILRRLDKLDEILTAIKELRGENAQLRKDLDQLRAAGAGLKKEVEALPRTPSPTAEQLAEITGKAAEAAVAKYQQPRFSLLGVNIGADDSGDLTFTGSGRYFAPFRENFALQAQAEYLSFHGRKEGQFDIGLVNRYKNFQMGLFSSFKNISLSEYQKSGTLGQASLTADYLFGRGKVGLFGSRGFLDNVLIDTRLIRRNIIEETYLRTVDQIGASGTVALAGRAWAEGNIGYLKSRAHTDRPGGTLRLVFPFSQRWAFTVEGGVNETLLGPDNTGRVVAGLRFGNFIQPKDFVAMPHPVPVDIPRVRYELLTRTVRTGNDAPVADAGPDQIGVAAGSIRLDGSASFDPDGDPITFQWSQIAGPAVSLTGMTQAVATFTAAEGQSYSFRLLVRDNQGAQSLARVTVTTRSVPEVRILSFGASPDVIETGQSSTLTWQVENADTVTISGGVGSVHARSGSARVTPADSTVYVLTARNRGGEATAQAVVTVQRPMVSLVRCQVTPANIVSGEAATLAWESRNADQVTLSGVGPVALTGSHTVSPTTNTTYTITARNRFGEISCPLTVQVSRGSVPRILSFTASPIEILAGETSGLSWLVEGADEVTVSTLGKVAERGNSTVQPSNTTTYTLVAKNRFGEISATATVTVIQPVRILSFTASPNPVARPNDPFVLSWTTENAVEVAISQGLGPRPHNGSVTLRAAAETTYILTAIGRRNQATATVTVRISQIAPPPAANRAPVANAGNGFYTAFRDTHLDGSSSIDPDGDTLTYQWRTVVGVATIANPNAARTAVRLERADYGNFLFELTVSDPSGASSTSRVIVRLVENQPTL